MKKKKPKWKLKPVKRSPRVPSPNFRSVNDSKVSTPKARSNTDLLYENLIREEISTYLFTPQRRKVMQRHFKIKKKLRLSGEESKNEFIAHRDLKNYGANKLSL